MSEIDLKDLNLGQELATSEVQSVSDIDQHHFQLFPLMPPNALHKSNQPNYRLSETVAYRRPQSIVTDGSRGSYQEDSERGSTPGLRRSDALGEGEAFQCHCCQGQGQGCPFCGDQRVIKGGSNIIKFFEYVIAFKLGNCQSYGQKRLTSTVAKNTVNQFCSDFFNNRTVTQSQYSIRDSEITRTERLSIRSKKCAKSELGKELNIIQAVHENYCCDICKKTPIVGNRYHCSQCEDYDECEQCHMRSGHRHLMQRIEKSGKARQMEGLMNILSSQQMGRTSLKPPPSIKKSLDLYSVTTKSALR